MWCFSNTDWPLAFFWCRRHSNNHLNWKLLFSIFSSHLVLHQGHPSYHSLALGVSHLLTILHQGCQQNHSSSAWWRKIPRSLLTVLWHWAPRSLSFLSHTLPALGILICWLRNSERRNPQLRGGGTSWVSSTFLNTFYGLFFSVLQEREILGEIKGKSSSTISCDVLSLCQPSSTVKLGRRWECSRQALLGRCCFQIWHFSTLFSSLVLSRNSRKIKKSLTQHLTLAFSTKLWCESHIYYIIWFSKKV